MLYLSQLPVYEQIAQLTITQFDVTIVY
jgi:hypothetical protein